LPDRNIEMKIGNEKGLVATAVLERKFAYFNDSVLAVGQGNAEIRSSLNISLQLRQIPFSFSLDLWQILTIAKSGLWSIWLAAPMSFLSRVPN
jgi:hypothetical protein